MEKKRREREDHKRMKREYKELYIKKKQENER